MSKSCFSRLHKVINGQKFNSTRFLCFSTSNKHFLNKNTTDYVNVPLNQTLKHDESRHDETQLVLDIYKERLQYSSLLEEEEKEDRFHGLNLTRGIYGVFDIDDLVETLRHQNAEDIFVASVSKEIKYVDYMVIVSGRSQRHMQAIAQFVRRVYKHKRNSSDILPRIEGDNSQDWMALDLGNIALHIFSKKARLIYDLDSLWAVGPKYDEECNKKESISNMLEKHSVYLDGLEPAS